MNSKIFSLVALSVFAVLFAISFVSAVITLFPDDYSASITQGQSDSFNFKIYNDGGTGGQCVSNCTLVNISATPSDLSSSTSTLSSSNIVIGTLPNSIVNQTNSSSISATINVPSTQATGTYTGTITVSGKHNETGGPVNSKLINLTVTVVATPSTETHFCDYGQVNESNMQLDVRIRNYGEGDDNSWNPLDRIEVQVKLKNDFSDYDLKDVVFEIGLFEKGTNINMIDDMAWISEDDELYLFGDLDSKERGEHTFEFKVDPSYVDSGDYLLKVKAYQEMDEDMYCVDSATGLKDFGSEDYYADISIKKQSDKDLMVVVDDTEMILLSAACGSHVSLQVDVWNVGTRDFNDQIMVSLYNQELGIDEKQVYLNDLYSGDNARVYFDFDVPKTAEEKQYVLYMYTYYDYDKDAGTYEQHYDRRSDNSFKAYLNVNGSCIPDIESITPNIIANLLSEAKAGQEVLVNLVITNSYDKSVTYFANLVGYSDWASSARLDLRTFTLAPGESKNILATVIPNKDTYGVKTFNLELSSNGFAVISQPVSITIEEAPAKTWAGITGFSISENKTAFALGLLNVILILAIIIVAIKFARK